jgi:antitoxin (DNA-binding transcriptional repressor) of toxin-antitoxin stability system
MNASIVDLRYHMKDVLRAIDRGETVTVLYRGKAKAKLMPMAPSSGASNIGAPKTKDQPLFGLWSDRGDLVDPASYLRNLRQARPILAQASSKKRAAAKKPK